MCGSFGGSGLPHSDDAHDDDDDDVDDRSEIESALLRSGDI